MTDEIVETQLILNGGWTPAEEGQRYDVHNPARPSELVGQAAAGTARDVDRAVSAAQKAFPAWAALSYHERAEYLLKVADALNADTDEIAQRSRLFTREHGKILRETQLELVRLGDRFRYCASLADQLARDQEFSGPPLDTLVGFAPRGVAALITPWNWPLSILGAKLPQALIAGNTVVVKLARSASLAPAQTLHQIARHLPPGVVNMVSGSGSVVGEALLRHPLVAKVNFTGSIQTGKQVMRIAAESLKHVTLELGGNDPGLVLEDADLSEEALRRMTLGVFLTSGQVCMALKRIYVHQSRFQELVEGFSALVDQHVVGDGLEPSVTMGPLNNQAQLETVRELVGEARERGATLRELGAYQNGENPPEGYFHLPTIVTDVDESCRVVREEQFGPVIPILSFRDEDEAIQRANDSQYGLCSSVWTTDPERALGLARRLQAGYTYLNGHGPMAQDDRAPFGGVKQSGIGRNLGYEGVLEFLEPHAISAPAGWLQRP